MHIEKLRLTQVIAAMIFFVIAAAGCSLQLNPYSLQTQVFKLPLPASRISFGELVYDARMGRLIVPAAETGNLLLINPKTSGVQQIQGFSHGLSASKPIIGAIAAETARGSIFALDQAEKALVVVDPASGKITASVSTQGSPDDLAYISATQEVWVAEKDLSQIEVFKASQDNPPVLTVDGTIPVPNGPESLLFDRARGLLYTNQPDIGQTLVLQVNTRGIVTHWGNGCSQARGMAIDEEDGYLFVVCQEGKLVVMDVTNDGSQVASQNYGGDLKYVAYNPKLRHIYLPSGASAILAVFDVPQKNSSQPVQAAANETTPNGYPASKAAAKANTASLVRLGTADTAMNAVCIASDDQNNIWVCDPSHGQLLRIPDTFSPGG